MKFRILIPLLFLTIVFISTSGIGQNHVFKVQIQGDDMDRDIVRKWDKGKIITKDEAIDLLEDAWDDCNDKQKKQRNKAYEYAKRHTNSAPVNGIASSSSWSKSFENSSRDVGNARIDFEIYRGAAFSHDRHIVYLKIEGSDLSRSLKWSYDEKYIVTKTEALAQLKKLWNSLSKDQKAKRDDAYDDAVRYIERAPINGLPGSNKVKNFKNSDASAGELIRVTIDKGAAFCK